MKRINIKEIDLKRGAVLPILLMVPLTVFLLYETGMFHAVKNTVTYGLKLESLWEIEPVPCIPPNSTTATSGRTNRTDSMDHALSFIPLKPQLCSNIFTTKEAVDGVGPNFTEAYERWNEKLIKVGRDLKWAAQAVREGDMRFGYWIHKNLMLIRLARIPCVKTICETGFKAGYSALTFLMSNPDVEVYSFDNRAWRYSEGMAEYISDLFPGRFHIVWGNSSESLPKFHKQYPSVKCDVSLIDGQKTGEMVKSDFENFRELASCHSVILLNECVQSAMEKVSKPLWDGWVKEGVVSELFQCSIGGWGKGYCMGRYTVPTCKI